MEIYYWKLALMNRWTMDIVALYKTTSAVIIIIINSVNGQSMKFSTTWIMVNCIQVNHLDI